MSIAKTRMFRISAVAIAALLSGCATVPADAPAETPQAAEAASAEDKATADRADPLVKARFWGEEYAKDPSALAPATSFAKALRVIGSHERAAAVARDTLILHPTDYELLMLLGRAELSQNNPKIAVQAFGRAIQSDPSRADAFAALGLSYDQLEQHKYAHRAYEKALAIDPARTSTLSNYGMSLALTGDLITAEQQLQTAAARPDANLRVKQNLALVLGLQGKYDEMKIASAGAPRAVLEENVRLLKQMNGDRLPKAAASSTLSAPEAAEPDVPVADKVVPVASAELAEIDISAAAETPELAAPAPTKPDAEPAKTAPAFALRGSLD